MFHNSNGLRANAVTNAVLSEENMKYAKQIQLLFFFIISPLNLCNMLDSLEEHSSENNSSDINIRETASLSSSSKVTQRTLQNEGNDISSNASQAYLDSDLFRLIVNGLGNFDELDEEERQNTTINESHVEDLEDENTQKESNDMHEGESQTKGIWKLPPEFVASLNLNSVIPSLGISPPNNQSNVTHGNKVDTHRDESRPESAWLPGILSQHSLHPVSVIESRSFVTNPAISSLRVNYILAKPEKVVENKHRRQYSSAEDPDSSSVETTEDFARFLDDDYKRQLEKEAEAMIKRKNSQDKKQDTASAEEKKPIQTTPVETEQRKSQQNPMFKNHVFFFKGDEDMFKDFFGFGGHSISGPKLHSEFYQGETSSETPPPSGQEILNHDDHEENFDSERHHEDFHGHHYPKNNAIKTGSSLCEQGYKAPEGTPGSYEEHSYEEAPEQPSPHYNENINEPGPYYDKQLNPPVDFQSESPVSHYHQGHLENIQHQSQEAPHHQGSGETSNNYHDGSVEQTPGYHQDTNEPGYHETNVPTYHKDSGSPNTDYPPEADDSSNSYEDNPNHRPSKEYSDEEINYSKESQNVPEQNYDSKEYDGNDSPCQDEERANHQGDKFTTPAVRHQYEVNHQYREAHVIKGESNFQRNKRKNPEIRTVSNPHAFPMQKENLPKPIYQDGPLRHIRLEGGFKPVLRTTVKPNCDDVDSPNSLDHWRHPPGGPDALSNISPTSGEQWTARDPVILPIIRLRHPILTPPQQTFGAQRRERSPEVLTPLASSEQKSAEKVPEEKKKSRKKQSKSRKFKKSRRRRYPKKPKKKKRSKRDHMKAQESSYHWGLEKHKDMDGFFMYANIPGSENYEYGYRVGGPEHNLERHHRTEGQRSTIKLNWEDQNGDSGDQYWEFNHDDVEEPDDNRRQKPTQHSKQ